MRKNLYFHPKAKKSNKKPEQTVQQGVFKHITPLMQFQKYKKFICYRIGNGDGRSAAAAGFAKQMGVLSGLSDIIVHLPPRKKYEHDCCSCRMDGRTVFIELKLLSYYISKKGATKGRKVARATKQEDSQVWFEEVVTAMGFPYYKVEATDISDGLNKILDIIKTEGGFEW